MKKNENEENLFKNTHLTAYVILSGLKALIMHNFCNADLFFHSCGNFSFSGTYETHSAVAMATTKTLRDAPRSPRTSSTS